MRHAPAMVQGPRCQSNDRSTSIIHLARFDRGGGSWTRRPAGSADPWKFAFSRGLSQAAWRRSLQEVSPCCLRSAWSRGFQRCPERVPHLYPSWSGGCGDEVLDLLGLREVVVVGWSLGGHIALEMASQFSGIKGLLISGAPPVSRHNMAEGFIPTPHMRLAGQQYLGPSEIDAFGEAIFGAPIPVAFRRAIERADGLARKTIFEAARSGVGIDQRCLVENLAVPLAVVNGSRGSVCQPRLFRGSEIREFVGRAVPSPAGIEARAVLGSAGRF